MKYIDNPTRAERAEFVGENENKKIVDIYDDNNVITRTMALEDNEIYEDGQVKKDPEYLARKIANAKAALIAENEAKRNVKYIGTSVGYLKTETPLGDLKMAIGLFDKIVAANQGLPANSIRLYHKDGTIFGNEAMTVEQYGLLAAELAMKYVQIDAYSTQITKQITEATSLSALNKIKIDYTTIVGEVNES